MQMQISGVDTKRKFLLAGRGVGGISEKIGEEIGEEIERKVAKARGDAIFRARDENIFLDYGLPW
jgi:hypothetical protein